MCVIGLDRATLGSTQWARLEPATSRSPALVEGRIVVSFCRMSRCTRSTCHTGVLSAVGRMARRGACPTACKTGALSVRHVLLTCAAVQVDANQSSTCVNYCVMFAVRAVNRHCLICGRRNPTRAAMRAVCCRRRSPAQSYTGSVV